ncbi:thioredoxin domain-containing protein [Desulfohalovibrio reitneri]|uniref:thioredoxin domain-containing protein n=1 Tax=Desulfohalovibrio reitneri TaxID=1307759 RepID=UPI00069220A2|nr:thioredoxin domain-containing protein [Desulfohalovibrio reitneri]
MTLEFTTRAVLFLLLIGFGLAMSILSLLENRVDWVSRLCSVFGSGCRRTARFSLLAVPVAVWGVVFYVVLLAAVFWADPFVFWFVMAGLGFELTFVRILVVARIFCIFCVLNAVAIVGLAALAASPGMLWEAAATALFFYIVSGVWLNIENEGELESEDESSEYESEDHGVAAKVDGRPITEDEIQRPLIQDIHQHQMEVFRLKRDMLDTFLREEVLRLEAERRGIQLSRLVQEHALCGLESDDEECHKRIEEFADELAANHEIEILMRPPPLPCVNLDVTGSPAKGPDDAEVVVVEFSDYMCPACGNAHEEAKKVQEHFQGRVRWVFMNFPLPMHRGADVMARAALCAREQYAFWEYQDRMFVLGGYPGFDGLVDVAGELGLETKPFRECLEQGRHKDKVDNDFHEGRSVGVVSTPTFFINGRMQRGMRSHKEAIRIIEEEEQRCIRLRRKKSRAKDHSHGLW